MANRGIHRQMENAPLSLEYSLDELIGFLDYLADKGLVNKNTIVSRKAACNKMLALLDPGEAADLRGLDVDLLATRFGHLKGKTYTAQSLQVYKSRVVTALADFFRYKENPANFKVGGANPKSTVKVRPKSKGTARLPAQAATNALNTMHMTVASVAAPTINFPVPLRSNCVVQINGLPVDLTKAEAAKIAAVVNAMISVAEE